MGFESDAELIEVHGGDAAIVFLGGDIDETLASKVVQSLYKHRAAGKTEVTLFISSGGGMLSASVAIADAVRACRDYGMEVHGLVTGMCASGAVFPLLECSTRKATPMSVLMVHGMVDTIHGDQQNQKIQQALNDKLVEQHIEYFASKTKRTEPEYWRPILESATPHYYMADEAVVEGIVDAVI